MGFCLHECLCTICGSQEAALDPPELGFKMIVSYILWVLEIEPRSSARIVSVLVLKRLK